MQLWRVQTPVSAIRTIHLHVGLVPSVYNNNNIIIIIMNADLFAETEGFLTAVQDQVVLTRNYKKYKVVQI